jgi:DNA-binding MarR family transcriptional regulator
MDTMEAGHDFETLEAAVRRHLMDALTRTRGKQRQAASLLGVTRWKLARMVERFELRDFVTRLRNADEHVTRTPVAAGAPEASTCGHQG